MLVPLGTSYAEAENAALLKDADPVEYRAGRIVDLRADEVLHLVAHSGDADFGGYVPKTLVRFLDLQGLKPSVAAIQLHGCQSAKFAEEQSAAGFSVRQGPA